MWTPERKAQERATVAGGMAFAKRWRLANELYNAMRKPINCWRCLDTGLIWWCGRAGQGGRQGPCSHCQREGASRFIALLRWEHIGA